MAEVISILVIWFMKLTQFLGSVPFTYVTCKFNSWQAGAYYFVLAGALLAIKYRRDKRRGEVKAVTV